MDCRTALRLSPLLAVFVALGACSASARGSTGAPLAPGTALPRGEDLTLILIGDTGQPGEDMDRVRRAVKAEAKDAIVVLGDLVYPQAPLCPEGTLDEAATRMLDERLGGMLADLGAPVILALGNHDVAHKKRDRAREACLLAYVARMPTLHLPSLAYVVDLGVASLAVMNTNDLDATQARIAGRAWESHQGWRLMAGHHVLKTFHDKVREDVVRPWLETHGLHPDLYMNGHAHVLQMGVYGDIPAVTSGATARRRVRPACPPHCGPGQRWGQSVAGYALLRITRDRLEITFKDTEGKVLHRWHKVRQVPETEEGG